ncbi:S9 family peptidase [Fredinandcohnia humi]
MTEIKRRGIVAEDLYKLKMVNDPQFAPNGESYVFVETEINKDKHDYNSHLYLGTLDGKVTQWTFGDVRDSSPRWSPNGDTIAFISNRSGKSQIYVMSANGGEPKQATYCVNGARNPIWSPDGSKILFVTSLDPEETITDKEKKKSDEDDKKLEPMVVDRIRYKSDAAGFLDNKSQHLGILHIATGEVEQLTSGAYDYAAGCWSPDGTSITFIADIDEDSDYNLVSDVFVMSLEDKRYQKITGSNGNFGNPSWSPDGKYIALIGHEKEFMGATLPKIWLYSVESGDLACLTVEWDVYVGDIVVGDFQLGGSNSGVIWNEDSRSFYFLMSNHGNTGVYYGSIDGEMYPSLFENQHVFALTVNNHKAVVGISKPTQPGDLYYLDLSNGELNQLTYVNAPFLQDVELSDAEPFTFKAPDGWDINGWVMKPFGYEKGKKYPTIIEVHGGPHAMYANTYFHEFQVLTGKGFVVVFTNPRGSHGYGQHFVDAVRGDYGNKDYLDVMAATDYAVENFDFVDETKLGVTGGSYGGFMTNWIVGHTNRFKAAVTQRSISNWLSFYGVSDIGFFFTEWELKGNLLEDAEKLWDHSPLKYVGNVETPLLILHGERDFRCPIEQAEQFYVALKHQKKITKFVRFPDANHELSRSGNPKLRLARLNHIKDWFVEYLTK